VIFELWKLKCQLLHTKVARSRYGGGNPLRSAALMHNYAIVASGWGEFIGSNGVDIDVPAEMTLRPQTDATVRMATIDLDAVMVNFNSGCGNSEFVSGAIF
jgi:hypothetical protein